MIEKIKNDANYFPQLPSTYVDDYDKVYGKDFKALITKIDEIIDVVNSFDNRIERCENGIKMLQEITPA